MGKKKRKIHSGAAVGELYVQEVCVLKRTGALGFRGCVLSMPGNLSFGCAVGGGRSCDGGHNPNLEPGVRPAKFAAKGLREVLMDSHVGLLPSLPSSKHI